jgi:redox-sensitive bicupin YhaK (pirin superfamily)
MNTLQIQRANQRFATKIGWLDSKHAFSFGHHYDPSNVNFGKLLVSNDDRVAPGTGFDTHPHRDMEIVTWVLSGELEHKDSEGNRGLLYPGLAQRMSAGRGIWHSEKNYSQTDEVHFIQMWVPPDTEGIDPGYQQLDINDQLVNGGLVPVASGQGHEAAIRIQQAGAVLWAARLSGGETIVVPDGPFVNFFMAKGDGHLEHAGELHEGDTARIEHVGELTFTAGPEGAEPLIWVTS